MTQCPFFWPRASQGRGYHDPSMAGTQSSLNQRLLDLLIERIDLLNSIGHALSTERDPMKLQERILLGSKLVAHADGGTFYAVDREQGVARFVIMRTDSLGIALGGVSGRPIDLPGVPLYNADGEPNHASVVAHAVLSGRAINIPDAYNADGFDFSATRAFDLRTGYRSESMLTVPMTDHEGEIIGVLQLLNAQAGEDDTVIPFSRPVQRMVESLASQAAIALTRQHLIEGMHELFESFVALIAHAIDEKSPHTGAHCQRVPELTMMIANALGEDDTGPLAGFTMDEDGRRELYIAALLHDCGKIATPEWLMDKATRLQRPFDRIELIRTRFAAIKRDLEAVKWQAIAMGTEPETAEADEVRAREELEADLEFLEAANRGEIRMGPAMQGRVHAIAAQTWCDPDGQIVPLLTADEVHNLCIERGTLTEEEREVIRSHVRVSIEMLESLPYPRHLRRVPEFAGGHHERCDGKGYPRRLTREQMSVQARTMAIADVFEALTAADRPYKEALTLSRALKILRAMVDDGHLDPDIFAVFIRRGVYATYAARFLPAAQIDAVDHQELLAGLADAG